MLSHTHYSCEIESHQKHSILIKERQTTNPSFKYDFNSSQKSTQRFLCRNETGLDAGSDKMHNHVINILFRRTMCCLEFFLSGFIVLKMKSHQQNGN